MHGQHGEQNRAWLEKFPGHAHVSRQQQRTDVSFCRENTSGCDIMANNLITFDQDYFVGHKVVTLVSCDTSIKMTPKECSTIVQLGDWKHNFATRIEPASLLGYLGFSDK
jgi:hypothetical protein